MCDGNNGTPNLKDRFIVGAGNLYNPSNTGGRSTVALTTTELPAHNHTATTGTESSHTHPYIDVVPLTQKGTYNLNDFEEDSGGLSYVVVGSNTNKTTSAGSSHNHSVTVASAGSGASFDIRPPYYALAFIMKL